MRRAGRIALWTAGSILLALVVFVLVFDWNWLKGPLANAVVSATGRTLEVDNIAGQWRLHPRVRLEQVKLSNPDWAQAPHLLTADALEVKFALLPLLFKRVHVYELLLSRPEVNLERLEDGRATWLFDKEQKDEGTQPVIDIMRVDEGILRYSDAITAAQITAGVQDRADPADPRSLKFELEGKVRGGPVKITGETASLLSLRDPSLRLPIAASGEFAGTRISIEGELAGLATPAEGTIRYSLSGPSLSLLETALRVPLPETPPYSVTGMLSRSGDEWHTTDLKGKVGKSDIAGSVKVHAGGKVPRIEAELTSSLLDLADLGPLIGATNRSRLKPTPEDEARLLPNRSFNPESFAKVDAHVVLQAKQVVRAANFPFDNFAADLRMTAGQVVIDPVHFGMAGGKLAGRIMLDARKPPIQMALVARMDGVNVAKIAPKSETMSAAAGILTGRIDLKGRGNSIAKMLGTADGRVTVLLANGNVPGLLPALVDLDGARVLANLVGKNPESVRCSVFDLQVTDGIAQPTVAVVETETTVLTAEGRLNLGTEALDLKLSQAPKKPSILSLRTPILVRGTLMNPNLVPAPAPLAARGAAAALLALVNPLAAVFALIETGPGEDGTCPVIQRGYKPAPSRGAKGGNGGGS